MQMNMEDRRDIALRQEVQGAGVYIQAGYTYSRIVTPRQAIELCSKEFRARARNAQFSEAYQRGHWDGMYSMINKRDGSFGTGLLPDLVNYLKCVLSANIKIEDLRVKPERMYHHTWEFPYPLRETQEAALKVLETEDRGIVKLPTGVGKTLIMSKLIQEKGVRTLICVPSKELLYQTAEVLDKNIGGPNRHIGLLGDGHWPEESNAVVVAIYASLVSLRGKNEPQVRAQFIESMSGFDMLLCDECHKVCTNDSITKTWETIMDINTYYRYGFSATPFEKAGTVAEVLQRSAFGHLIYNMEMTEAREAGYVTPFTVYMCRPEYPREYTEYGTTGLTWQDAHDYYIVNNEVRNKAIISATKALLKDGRKVLVVAHRIPHNEHLAQMLAEEIGDANVYMLHGQLDTGYRKRSMAEYKARKDPCVMVASSVGNDGIDIPDISGLVLAHGGKSFFQNVQRTGRGLRTANGKKDLWFVDFDDSKLGRWFSDHTRQRLHYYEALGAKIMR